MAAYLLGELDDNEQQELERDYFSNEEAYQQLLAAEDELVYDYVEDRLSQERRHRCESTILATPRGRKNLEFARLLLTTLRSGKSSERPFAAWIAIAAAVVLAIAGSVLTLRLTALRSDLASARKQIWALESRVPSQPQRLPLEVSFLLHAGTTRSDGSTRLNVPANADTVRIELLLPPGASAGDYSIAVRASGGAEVWSRTAAASGKTIVIAIPAAALPAGSYEIGIRRLAAGEQPPELATYSFRLIRP